MIKDVLHPDFTIVFDDNFWSLYQGNTRVATSLGLRHIHADAIELGATTVSYDEWLRAL